MDSDTDMSLDSESEFDSQSDEEKSEDSEGVNSEGEDEETDLVAPKSAAFGSYRPSVKFGSPHPQELCEGSGLVCTSLPPQTYKLKMKKKYYTRTQHEEPILSIAQIEAIIYACQSFETVFEVGKVTYRQGFLLGDGTGVGKGRTLAGIIKELYHQNHRLAVWITPSPKLFEDARKEVERFFKGAVTARIQDMFGKTMDEGVVFCTYNLAARHENQKKILEFLGTNFKGPIILDEAHNMKSGEDSNIGKFLKELQKKYPEARIVYASATAAFEAQHLVCMQRLQLYGDGQAFKTQEMFVSEMSSLGISALELLSMDLKRRGVFVTRNISLQGVEIKTLKADATSTFNVLYKRCCQMWLLIYCYMQTRKDLPSHLYARYYSSVLHFFSILIMTSKVRSVVAQTLLELKSNNAVIIGLQNTGASGFEDFHQDAVHEGLPFSNCAAILQKFLANIGVPIGCPKTYTKTQGVFKFGNWTEEQDERAIQNSRASDSDSDDENEEFKIEACDSEYLVKQFQVDGEEGYLTYAIGNKPFTIPATELLWSIETISKNLTTEGIIQLFHELYPRLPVNPLDELEDRLTKLSKLNSIEESAVANCTGRPYWHHYDESLCKWKQCPSQIGNEAVKQFMSGEKTICIISDASSYGISLHSDKDCNNQRRRVQIVLQVPYSPQKLIQQIGRSHRSNQAHPPIQVMVESSIKGEVRFDSIEAVRLQKMGAICEGHGEFNSIKNQLNGEMCSRLAVKPAIAALEYMKKMDEGFKEIWNTIGVEFSDKSYFTKGYLQKMVKFYNRVLLMDPERQALLIGQLRKELTYLIEAGNEVEQYIREFPPAEHDIELLKTEVVESSSGTFNIHTFELNRILTWEELKQKIAGNEYEYFEQKNVVGARKKLEDGSWTCYYPYSRLPIHKSNSKMRNSTQMMQVEVWKPWESLTTRLAAQPGCLHITLNPKRQCKNPCYYNYGKLRLAVLTGPLYQVLPKVKCFYSSGLKLAIVKDASKGYYIVGLLIDVSQIEMVKTALNLDESESESESSGDDTD